MQSMLATFQWILVPAAGTFLFWFGVRTDDVRYLVLGPLLVAAGVVIVVRLRRRMVRLYPEHLAR
jgi:hypothetical protein